jgi:ubiquinone/menaquinone biosynthesis C-methylase UbiE
LATQAAFFEDLTGDVFQRAGIGMGMQVLDLGCGVGDVSFLAAGMVGAAGTVLGIDRNASSIQLVTVPWASASATSNSRCPT